MDNAFTCGGFVFVHNFDSGNLGHVEQVPKSAIVAGVNTITNAIETPDYEFNLWTRPDCAGTEFENGNRTWFYFGIQAASPQALVKLNIVNLNRQTKMYSQGMAPVTKTIPGKNNWERIKDRPSYLCLENIFTLSFKYRTPENRQATSYFAFTYPYTYAELQNTLGAIDARMLGPGTGTDDDIYYCRECVTYSLERRRMDLLTITSRHGITAVREDRLKNLFPDQFCPRPFKFLFKKVIILSARVHPGETPSSFVLNGFLNLLLSRHDPVAISLRRIYVFKLVPFLNPDGVARGQYRTDTRGVNLNRVYLAPSLELHPTIYAARSLIRYYHYGFEKEDTLDSSENVVVPPRCESDCNSSDLTLDKDFDNPDQENVKCYELCSKRKKMSISKEMSISKDMNRHWSNLTPMRSPLQSKSAATNTGSSPRRLKVDSEDDTSSSLLLASPTLADQVEDLNINQQSLSLDGFNPTSLDDECAVDHLLQPPSPSAHKAKGLSLSSELTSDDDDSVMCGTHQFEDASVGDMTAGESLKFSQSWCMSCVKTIKELEAKMPGISNMLPAKYKDSTNSDRELGTSRCVNCHTSLRGLPPGPGMEPLLKGIEDSIKLSVNSPSPRETFTLSGKGRRDKNSSESWKWKKQPVRTVCPLKGRSAAQERESGLYLYMDMHGHASKKGIFMYGNHFEEVESSVECLLLPRLMALNSLHFHFSSCNFTERNMYLRDRRDGMSREGSGRVAVLKATGLTRSYTLECNYNTGRLVNVLPPAYREPYPGTPPSTPLSPPKYTPPLFEEVGKTLGASVLDLTGHHPNSRLPNSEHRNLAGLREWLRSQQRPSQATLDLQISVPRASTSRTPRPSCRPSRRPGCPPTPLAPLVPLATTSPLPPIALSAGTRPHSSRLHSAKFLSARAKVHSDPSFSSKTQRNMSLISIKKPAVAKHPKAPLKNKSPSRRLPLGTKGKQLEEGEGGIRNPMESARLKRSPKEPAKQKLKSLRKEPPSYQKQPAQLAAKPASKRLKIAQFVKYTDNAKEKYRVRKIYCGKAGASGSPDDWEPAKDLTKVATTHNFV